MTARRGVGFSMLETLLVVALVAFTLAITGPTLLRVIRVPALADEQQTAAYQREQAARRLLADAWSATSWSLDEAQNTLRMQTPDGEITWEIQPETLIRMEGPERQPFAFTSASFAMLGSQLWLTHTPEPATRSTAAQPAGPRRWLLQSQARLLTHYAGDKH